MAGQSCSARVSCPVIATVSRQACPSMLDRLSPQYHVARRLCCRSEPTQWRPALDFGRSIAETGLAGRSALVSGGKRNRQGHRARSRTRRRQCCPSRSYRTRGSAAAQEIADETGVTVVGVQADVTDTNSLKAAVAHLSGLASFINALNIVVNNAAPPITLWKA